MKKVFILTLLVAFALVGCKKDKGGEQPKHNEYEEYDKSAEKLVFTDVSGSYYGSQFTVGEGNYKYNVILSNHPNILDIMSKYLVMEEGSQYLYIDFYSTKPADSPLKFKVPNGVYTFAPDDSTLAGTVGTSNSLLMALDANNIFFSKGTVTVTDSQIIARLTSEEGVDYLFTGANLTVDNTKAYGVGATNSITSTLTDDMLVPYDSGELLLYAINMGDDLCVGKTCWVVYAEDIILGDTFFTTILTDVGAESPVGTYTVSGDITKNGALRGYADGWGYCQGTWWSKYTEDGTAHIAPIVGGTITLTWNADGIGTLDFQGLDDHGHSIKGCCTSDFVVMDMPEPSSTPSVASRLYKERAAALALPNKVRMAVSQR